MNTVCRFLAVVALALLARAAGAEAGRFLTVVGEVRVVSAAGAARAAVRGAEVDAGETIITAENALAQLSMTDGTRLSVRPESELTLEDYAYREEEASAGRIFMSLVRGTLRSITGFIGQRNRRGYRVRTPHATIGIRGTDHQTTVLLQPRDGFAPGTFDVVYSGRTAMQTQAGLIEIAPQQAGYVQSLNAIPRVIQVPAFLQPGAVQVVPARPGAATVQRRQAPAQRAGEEEGKANVARERVSRPAVRTATPLRTPLSSPLRTPLSDTTRSLSTDTTRSLSTDSTTTLEKSTTTTLESYKLDSSTTTLDSSITRTLDSSTTEKLESYQLDTTTTTVSPTTILSPTTTTTDTTTSTLRTLDPSTTTTIQSLDSSTTLKLDSSTTTLLPSTTTTLQPTTTTTTTTTAPTTTTTTTEPTTTTIIRSLDSSTLQRLDSTTTTISR